MGRKWDANLKIQVINQGMWSIIKVPIKLNEMQKKVLSYISDHKTIKRKAYAELGKCSMATAQR